jgi:uncharacterized protein with HEPN domain
MKKDDTVYLDHISICIEKINRYTGEADYESFLKNEILQDAIIRLMGIIGEASTKISNDLKLKYNNVSWADIKGMRNRIIHDYFNVRLDVVWNTIKNELPVLSSQITQILNEKRDQTKLNFDDN